jgi:hypothetical protein
MNDFNADYKEDDLIDLISERNYLISERNNFNKKFLINLTIFMFLYNFYTMYIENKEHNNYITDDFFSKTKEIIDVLD